ncbi:MOSC domain-containing protein [Kibdelosporangium aridum]|uniref:MOSC domain-containing protein n=1 Tax=Kibdelosporangium aridum TaxID=2030 RepID=UPI00068C12BF
MYALARPDGRYRRGLLEGLPKTEYFVLATHERLAGLSTHVAADLRTLTVSVREHPVLTCDLGAAQGRAAAEAFFARVLDCPDGTTPVVAREPGRKFTDAAVQGDLGMEAISVINLASVRDLAERIGTPLDPLRFRGNLYWDGLPPFAEDSLVGSEITIGECTFQALARIPRCAATEVAPGDGRRDLRVPRLMVHHYGHSQMGIYLQVRTGGTLHEHDPITMAMANA